MPARTTSSRLARCAVRLAVALAASSALLAHAGLFDDEEARRAILELRQRIENNRQANEAALEQLRQEQRNAAAANEEANAALRRSLLELAQQIEVLRTELARLRGADETLARDVAEVQRRQRDLAAAMDERVRRFEPAKVTVDGREFMAEPSEKRDFDAALALFRKGEFAPAQAALADFARRWPQSGYLPSAQFWLGNAHYALKDYREALAQFRALLAAAPDHVRAPEALLSVANCQIELKDARSARRTLEDLQKTYPQSEAAAAARERLAKLR